MLKHICSSCVAIKPWTMDFKFTLLLVYLDKLVSEVRHYYDSFFRSNVWPCWSSGLKTHPLAVASSRGGGPRAPGIGRRQHATFQMKLRRQLQIANFLLFFFLMMNFADWKSTASQLQSYPLEINVTSFHLYSTYQSCPLTGKRAAPVLLGWCWFWLQCQGCFHLSWSSNRRQPSPYPGLHVNCPYTGKNAICKICQV